MGSRWIPEIILSGSGVHEKRRWVGQTAAALKGEMRPELADAPHSLKRPVVKVAKRSRKPEEAQREDPCGHNRRKGVFFNIWTTQLAVQRLPESSANNMKAAGSPALPPPISSLILLDTNKNLAPAKGGLSSSFSQDSLLHVNHRFGLCRAAFNPIHFPTWAQWNTLSKGHLEIFVAIVLLQWH